MILTVLSFITGKLVMTALMLILFFWPVAILVGVTFALHEEMSNSTRRARNITFTLILVVFTLLYGSYLKLIWPDGPGTKCGCTPTDGWQYVFQGWGEYNRKIIEDKPPIRTDGKVEIQRYMLVDWNPPKHFYVTLKNMKTGYVAENVYVSKHCNNSSSLTRNTEYNLQVQTYTMSNQPGVVFYEFKDLYSAFCQEKNMSEFDTFFEKFKQSPSWKQMVDTVEASPWHREANVAVHTQMVLDQYNTRFAPIRTPEQNLIARVALLYHDVGKPAAEEVLEKKDGSGEKYRRYAGHEQDSSVAFAEEYVKNKDLQGILDVKGARIVRWIIEHHLPYGLKQRDKVVGLRTAVAAIFGEMENTFFDCLRSDSAGRISDDHEQKLANVEEWIGNFRAVPPEFMAKPSTTRTMYILLGPSGSGKSTWTKNRFVPGDVILSLDTFRIEFYKLYGAEPFDMDDVTCYAKAWEFANKEGAKFTKYINERSVLLMEQSRLDSGNVFIDNVNASRKSRAQWVQLAQKHGLKIVAVEFWNTLDTLIARQKTRGDKDVPAYAVKQHQYSMTCAWLQDECHDVIVVLGM